MVEPMADGANLTLNYAPVRPLRRRRLGPLPTALITGAILVPLVWLFHGPLQSVISGDLFTGSFDRCHAGMVLDQPTIGKWYLIFTVYSAMVLPYLVVARWISDRMTSWGYWAFAAPAAASCLVLLAVLTGPFYWLLQYIYEMGFTVRRIEGLCYGLVGYVGILTFLHWSLRRPRPAGGCTKAKVDQETLPK